MSKLKDHERAPLEDYPYYERIRITVALFDYFNGRPPPKDIEIEVEDDLIRFWYQVPNPGDQGYIIWE